MAVVIPRSTSSKMLRQVSFTIDSFPLPNESPWPTFPIISHKKSSSKKCPKWSSSHKEQQHISNNMLLQAYDIDPTRSRRSSSSRCCSRYQLKKRWHVGKAYVVKANKGGLSEKPIEGLEKKGTIGGAVALIIGTSVGSGILALPNKANPAGLVPSSIAILVCWAFLLIEALMIVELNVNMLRKKREKLKGNNNTSNDLEIISFRTMAQETLGEWGGNLATVNYIFLGYTSMVAYSSKSGVILCHLINFPESVSGFFFTAVFSILVSVGGTRATDQVNQWLTATNIGLLVAIEVLAVMFGGWPGLETGGNWGKVPNTIPVIIFSLVYHDLIPVLCAYLGGDIALIRTSVLLGSVIPLLALLIWDAIALGLSAQSAQVCDPVELLMRVEWSGVSIMVEAFSLLAIGTSLIGTLLGFSEFFKEQLNDLSRNSSPRQTLQVEDKLYGLQKWWESNKISFTSTTMVVVPALVVSTAVPDAFSAATDIAGGYCMTMLYGVLPPVMAWATYCKEAEGSDENAGLRAKPALVGVGLFACGIVMEQIFQDISSLHP